MTDPLNAAIDRIHNDAKEPSFEEIWSAGCADPPTPPHPVLLDSQGRWQTWHQLSELQSRIEVFGNLNANCDDPDDVNALMELQQQAITLMGVMLSELRARPGV